MPRVGIFQDARVFADLKRHVVRDLNASSDKPPTAGPQSRVGGSKKERGNFTPAELKPLIPGGGSLPGVSLVWQCSERSFQGYYKDAEPRPSTSASYGGPRTPADPAQALDRKAEKEDLEGIAGPRGTDRGGAGWWWWWQWAVLLLFLLLGVGVCRPEVRERCQKKAALGKFVQTGLCPAASQTYSEAVWALFVIRTLVALKFVLCPFGGGGWVGRWDGWVGRSVGWRVGRWDGWVGRWDGWAVGERWVGRWDKWAVGEGWVGGRGGGSDSSGANILGLWRNSQ